MKSRLQCLIFLAPVFMASPVGATPISWSSTAANSTWATGTNWVGGTAPANSLTTDIAVFNQTSYTGQPNAGTTSINGIQIGDGTTNTATLNLTGTALSIGSSGIDMKANAGIANLNSAITLGAAQTWQNASTNLLTIGGTVTNGGFLLTLGGTGNTTITGLVSGTGGLTKSGGGEAILSGGASYSGNTAINQGTLTFKAPLNADWTLGGGTKTIASGATMKVDLSTQTTQFRSTSIGTVVLNGTLNLSGTAANTDGFYIVNGLSVTSGAGNIDIIDNGSVIINSANALNNFTGTINVGDNVGTTQFTSQGSTSTAGTFSMNITSNGTYDLRTDSFVMGALNGSGAIIKSFNGFTGTLTIGNGGADGNYTGLMSDQATVYNVTKTGAGTQILGNTANTYSGVTTISGGTLSVTTLANGSSASSIGNSSNAATNLVFDGGTLKYTGATVSTDRNFTINTGKTATIEVSTDVSVLTITGATTNTNGILAKTGAGTLVLTGANLHTGGTSVTGGTLRINGSSVASNAFTVGASGTLGGTGTIGGTVNVSGVLAPGASVESLAAGAVTMNSGSTFQYEATNNSATGADLLAANGALSLTNVTLDLTGANLAAGTWGLGNKLTLISYDGIVSSGFTGYADDTIYAFGSNQWLFNYNDTIAGANFATDAATGDHFVTMTVVPEPAAALLGSLGLLALLRRRRGA